MEKPVSIYAAYRMVCENSRKPEPSKGLGNKDDNSKMADTEENPNSKYSKKALVSPFCKQTSACNPKSGVFSQDLTTVEAALNQGVSSNHTVNSSLIPMWLDEYGPYEEMPTMDVGLVDALTWQCLMGRDMNVRAILKAGYKAAKRYSGLNPITAAIRGRNLQCLKLVLAVPAIRELVNEKDGFGTRPIQAAAEISGIDPYEFAREVVKAGGEDRGYKDGQYSALMLCVLRHGKGAIWTPNIFAEILPVSDIDYSTKDGETVASLAMKLDNQDALRMIMNWQKFGEESLNGAVLNNGISF